MTVLPTAGLSHSEIRGSKSICIYPRLIAAYHVLRRLREHRHPPYALISFLTINPIIHIKYNAHKLTCTVQRLYNTEKNTI